MTNPSELFRNLNEALIPPAEPGGSVPPPTRSYLARSVDEAISQAREELGEEAMLLNTRKLADEEGLPGGYEVVFGVPQPEPPPALPLPHAVPDDLAADLERLHSQMDEIRNLLMRPAGAQSKVASGVVRTMPELAGVYDCLISSEVDPELSKDIVGRLGAPRAFEAHLQRMAARRAGSRGKPSLSDPDTLDGFVLAELERRVGIESELDSNDGSLVLVGPAGAGKTTTLAKLATLASELGGARPVRHLRLQEIAVQTLPSLIAEARGKEFLLIDTPSYSSADWKAAEEAAAALAGCPGVDVHLVVPGYMKSLDLRRCIQKYELFKPSKLLVTKMDETHSFGSVFSEAARAGLALSFLTHGPMIPRDIRPASPEDLLVLAVKRNSVRPANVA